MRKYASLILLWEKPDHRTAGFQAQHLTRAATVPQDYGRVSKTMPINTKAGRYQPDDDLLAFLKGL